MKDYRNAVIPPRGKTYTVKVRLELKTTSSVGKNKKDF